MLFLSSIEAKKDGSFPFLAFLLNKFALPLKISAATLKQSIKTRRRIVSLPTEFTIGLLVQSIENDEKVIIPFLMVN